MIFLIRHGQTIANLEGRFLGGQDSPLTRTGKAQHKQALSQLKGVSLDDIITSPSARCVVLAEALGKQANLQVTVDQRVKEYAFGVFEKLTFEEARSRFPDAWSKWESGDKAFYIPEGESLNNFESRIGDFAEEILKKGAKANIAVVTHGGVISTLLCAILKLDQADKWRFRAENGSIVKIEISDGFAYMLL